MSAIDPEAIVDRPRPLVKSLSTFWEGARELYRVLLPIRFSFLTLLVLLVALRFTDQGKDSVAALAEGNPTWKPGLVLAVQLLFAILVALFAAQTWYWSRQLLRVRFDGQPNPLAWPLTVKWVPRLLGVGVFGVAIGGLQNVRASYGGQMSGPSNVLFWLMIALAIEAAAFVVMTVIRRTQLGEIQTVRKLSEFGPSTRRILTLTVILAVVVLLGSTFAVQRLARIGTMSVLLISLGLWVALGGVVVYAGMRARIPILTWLLLFAIAISPLADNHAVRTIPAAPPARVDAAAAFDAWHKRLVAQTPHATAPRPVFIVASEGGGVRAAYWTAAVLTSLSDTVPGFTDHLFAVSGVSGGSVGAATYRSLLAEPSARGQLRRLAREALAYDALAPTISAFTQQDFVQRFLPLGFPDRAKALEQGWEHGWRRAVTSERFSGSFLATTTANADRLPSVLFNGTIVETGARAITSNIRIDTARFAAAVDAIDAIGADVPMSTAALNSARFPYVSPVGTMLNRHIADAGYFENSGAGTAADLVDVIRRHPEAKNIRPYVIFIDYRGIEGEVQPSRFANEILAPFKTIFAVRGAHAVAATAALKERLSAADRTTFTLVQHRGERYPLGWLLAARTRDLIDRQMGRDSRENGANVKAVAAVLGVEPTEDLVWKTANAALQ